MGSKIYMKWMTIQETTGLFHSYGLKCDISTVKGWIQEGKIKVVGSKIDCEISENSAYDFLHDYQWEGTAYERGINDQTKIERLEEDINRLKKSVEKLQKEIAENQLDIMPF